MEQTMKFEDVKEIVDQVEGSGTFILDTKTVVKLKGGKKNLLQERVEKTTAGSEVVIYNKYDGNGYSDLIKAQMTNEGKDPSEFELKPRAWGTRIENTPFVEHKGNYYIECIFNKSGKSEYLVDGEIYEDDIEGLPEKTVNDPTKAAIESQGGIETKIVIRTFSVEAIEKIELV
jgi:hypothetical protein